jgi:hypothetical protein
MAALRAELDAQWLVKVTDAEDPFGEDQTAPTATLATPTGERGRLPRFAAVRR